MAQNDKGDPLCQERTAEVVNVASRVSRALVRHESCRVDSCQHVVDERVDASRLAVVAEHEVCALLLDGSWQLRGVTLVRERGDAVTCCNARGAQLVGRGDGDDEIVAIL